MQKGIVVVKCDDQKLENAVVEWTLSQEDIKDVKKGEILRVSFEILGLSFEVSFLPLGTTDAGEGTCSLYLLSNFGWPKGMKFSLEVSPGIKKEVSSDRAKDNQPWGWPSMCPTPTTDPIIVRVLNICNCPVDAWVKQLELTNTKLKDQAKKLLDAEGKAKKFEKKFQGARSRSLIPRKKNERALQDNNQELSDVNSNLEGKEKQLQVTNTKLNDQTKKLLDAEGKANEFETKLQDSDRALYDKNQEISAVQSKLEGKEKELNELLLHCEKLKLEVQHLHDPKSQLCNLRSQMVNKIQKAWRAKLAHGRLYRIREEEKRAFQHARLCKRIAQVQRHWRTRQDRLRRCRLDLDAARMAAHRPSTKYDAIYSFQSLAEFISTGKVDLLQSIESSFDLALIEEYRIVAVVGLFDKGKTFLINKLFGVDLPSGKIFNTKGLSFLWFPERRMLVLDSAGVQATVSYRTQTVQPILDAQTTESLLFEMISNIAHSMIFVVNDLTWFEQKYVAMLHQKYVQNRQAKELIVVHNLRSTVFVQEAHILFERQIIECYDGRLSHLGDLIFTADQGDGVPKVHHVGLCQDGSAAGLQFNQKNCAWLLQMLELRDTLGSKIKLVDYLRDQLVRLLPIFVNLERPEEFTLSGNDGLDQQLCVDFQNAPPNGSIDGYVTFGSFRLRDPPLGHRVVMKTRGVISPLGEIIPHNVSFDPIVNVFDEANERGTRRFIQVECPGVEEDDVELEKLPNGIKITIEKRKAIVELSARPHPSFPIRQHHGTWERDFMFDVAEGHFDVPKEGNLFTLHSGVLTIVLERVLKNPKLKSGRRGARAVAHEVSGNLSPSPSLSTIESITIVS